MGEVLYGKLFFYGALYENSEQDKLDWMVTYTGLVAAMRNSLRLISTFTALTVSFPEEGARLTRILWRTGQSRQAEPTWMNTLPSSMKRKIRLE